MHVIPFEQGKEEINARYDQLQLGAESSTSIPAVDRVAPDGYNNHLAIIADIARGE